MSAWSWDDVPYIVKFNFMYLTEVCARPARRRRSTPTCAASGSTCSAQAFPSRRTGARSTSSTPQFVRENHDFERFKPLISPIFINDYLTERLGPL